MQKMKRAERKEERIENERGKTREKGGVMVIYRRHVAQISIRSAITNHRSLAVTLGWSLG